MKYLEMNDISKDLLKLPGNIREFTMSDLEFYREHSFLSCFPEMLVKWFHTDYYKEYTKTISPDFLNQKIPFGPDTYTEEIFNFDKKIAKMDYNNFNRDTFTSYFPFLAQDIYWHDNNHKTPFWLWKNPIRWRSERSLVHPNQIMDFCMALEELLETGKPIPQAILEKVGNYDGIHCLSIYEGASLGYGLAEIGRIEDAVHIFEILRRAVFVCRPLTNRKRPLPFGPIFVSFKKLNSFGWHHWIRRLMSVTLALGKIYKETGQYYKALEYFREIREYYTHPRHKTKGSYNLVYWFSASNRILECLIEAYDCYVKLGDKVNQETLREEIMWFFYDMRIPPVRRNKRYSADGIREPMLTICQILDRMFGGIEKE